METVLELFAKILPLAIASAMSPVILGVAVMLLSAKGGNARNAYAFLLGGAVVAAALAIAGYAAGSGVLASMGVAHVPATLDIALGIMCVGFAAKGILGKGGGGKRIGGAEGGAFKWFAIGLIANATNADAIVLNFTAVREIFREASGLAGQALLLGIADFFFLSPALVPLLAYMAAPKRARRALEPAGAWMERYGRYLVASIFLIFGIYLLRKGLGMG